MHHVRRSFDDSVDSRIPEGPLDRARDLTPLLQRGGGLIAPSTLELQGRVDQVPADLRVVHLCRGRLHPDVGVSAIRCRGAEVGERLHREVSAAQLRELVASRLVLADLASPLVPSLAPARQVCGQLLDRTRVDGRNAQPSVVECRQGESKTLPLPEDDVLRRHLHVCEPNQTVLDGAQPHEATPVHDLDAGCVPVHDEGRDLLDLLAALHDGRCGRHDHVQVGDHAVGTPELLAVDDPVLSVLRGDRRRLHLGRVGPNGGLGEAERTHGALRKTGQELLLLLLGTEQLQGLRNTDGLVCAQRRDGGAAVARDRREDAHVVGLTEAEAAVLGRDLDAEQPEVCQSAHHRGRNLTRAVDLLAVHVLSTPRIHLRDPLVADGLVFGLLVGKREAHGDVEVAHEHRGHERLRLPVRFAALFRHRDALVFLLIPVLVLNHVYICLKK